MKKILTLMFVLAISIYSCTKEGRINRQMEGKWKVISIGGVPETDDITYDFNKDNTKDGGEWSVKFSGGGYGGKYSISGETITLTTIITANFTVTKEDNVYQINKHSKKELQLTHDIFGLIEMEKK